MLRYRHDGRKQMEILKVKLSDEEIDGLFDDLIGLFDTDTTRQSGHTVNFSYDVFECESFLETYEDWSDFDENHQNHLQGRQVLKFRLNFFNSEGDEVETNCDLLERIREYYHI